MKVSIVTINYNNAEGLRRTLESVAAQTYRDIEHIVIDGGSTDNSVDFIKEYVGKVERMNELTSERCVIWSSEKDKGIYDAMNKGIEIALGKRIVDAFNRSEQREDKNKVLPDYVWILNSGDAVAAPNVIERMVAALEIGNKTLEKGIDILIGNKLQVYPGKKVESGRRKVECVKPQPMDVSMLTFYSGTVPQDAAFVKRELFEKYGYFDEKMKICADWKLYLNMIALGGVQPMYVNIDVVLFDMTGISNANDELRIAERCAYLKEILPKAVLIDYDTYAFPIRQYQRMKKHHVWPLVHFFERVLFKLEKWKVLR